MGFPGFARYRWVSCTFGKSQIGVSGDRFAPYLWFSRAGGCTCLRVSHVGRNDFLNFKAHRKGPGGCRDADIAGSFINLRPKPQTTGKSLIIATLYRCAVDATVGGDSSAELPHRTKVSDPRRNTPKSDQNRSESLCAGLWVPCRMFWAWFGFVLGPIPVRNRRCPAGSLQVFGALLA